MNLSRVIAKRPFILLRSVEDVEKDAAAVIIIIFRLPPL
jgi:hypothetical protein